MHRSFFISALISLTLLTAAAFGQSTPAWQKVTSAEGKFEVSFPFKPESGQNSFGVGENKVKMTLFTAEVPEGAFLVTYMDFNSDITDPNEALSLAQKLSVGSVDGTLLSSSATTFMGHPAREFKLRIELTDDLIMVAWVKAVLVERRLYQIAVVTSEANINGPMFSQFVSSFRLSPPAVVAKK